jgi:hypothetical protein
MILSKNRIYIDYQYSFNDKDFSIVDFFVTREYVVRVELLVFHQLLLNVAVENN